MLTSVHRDKSAILSKACKNPPFLLCQILPDITQASISNVSALPTALALMLISQGENSKCNPTVAHLLNRSYHTLLQYLTSVSQSEASENLVFVTQPCKKASLSS